MKLLEDIIIDIANWVKRHGPIKREFSLSPVSNRIIEQSRARSLPEGLSPRLAAGWQMTIHEDILIVFAGWRTPEGKATLYQPNVQAVDAVLSRVGKGATIGEAVDTFMKDLE